MKKSFDIDFHDLRRPLLFATGLLLLATLLIGASLQFRNAMSDEKHFQEGKVKELIQDYQELIKAEHIIETLYGRYRSLEQQGFIGGEDRLQWLEALRRTGDESGIMGMQYRLHEQHPYTGALPLDSGPYQLYASVMELQVDALHEGDLLVFLERLYDAGEGLPAVDGCTLLRLNGGEVTPGEANVRADCRLSWYTIRAGVDEDTEEELM